MHRVTTVAHLWALILTVNAILFLGRAYCGACASTRAKEEIGSKCSCHACLGSPFKLNNEPESPMTKD